MKNNKPSKEIRKDISKVIIAGLIMSIIILTAVICYLVYKGNNPKLLDGKQVVASIDGKEFIAEDLYDELKLQGGYSVLLGMIDETIIEKEIEDTADASQYADSVIAQYELQYKDYDMSFEEIVISSGYKSIDDFKTSIMNNYLYSEVAKKYIKNEVTDKELKDYYENHVSDELDVKHILISPEVKDGATSDEKKKAEEEALNKAKDLIKQLDEGADFETLAKENSDDEGTASNGGIINNVVEEKYVTEFWDAAYKLEVGKYTTEPVKSKFGYHIIYKVDHTTKKSFDDMKDSLYDEVVEEKTSDDTNLIEKTWIEIRKKYNLNIVDTSIQRIYDITTKNIEQ